MQTGQTLLLYKNLLPQPKREAHSPIVGISERQPDFLKDTFLFSPLHCSNTAPYFLLAQFMHRHTR